MTPHIRKTSEGLLVTTSALRFAYAAIGLLLFVATGAIGAARFLARAQDAPTRSEFHDFAREDSLTHRNIFAHSAFQDSVTRQLVNEVHRMACNQEKNPASFCADVHR